MPAYPPAATVDTSTLLHPVTYTVPSATTVTSAGLSSFATPVKVTVPVTTGQVVDIVAQFAGYNSLDSQPYIGIQRTGGAGTSVLVKGGIYVADARRPQTGTLRWTDTAPGTGNVSYELLGAALSGTLTANTSDGSTAITLTGSTGGGTQIVATPRST